MRVKDPRRSYDAIGQKSQENRIREGPFECRHRAIKKPAQQQQHDANTIDIEPGKKRSVQYRYQRKEVQLLLPGALSVHSGKLGLFSFLSDLCTLILL